MTGISLTADGADRLGRSLTDAATDLTDLTAVNRMLGDETLRAAQIPVRTGELKRSSYVDAGPAGFELAASAPYAGYVHARNPFFTTALDAREQRITDVYVEHVTDVLAQVNGD